MKEVKNWEAIIIEQGKDAIAIPLPGCIIKGEIDGEEVRIKAEDINLSTLTIVGSDNEKYRLSGAREEYLGKLNNFIEIGKNKDINIDTINIEKEINEGNER